jgi:hypothetical protein
LQPLPLAARSFDARNSSSDRGRSWWMQAGFRTAVALRGIQNLYDFREKRICQIRNNQSDDPASPGNQSPRLCIGVVAQFPNGLPHTPCQSRRHGRCPVYGIRTSKLEDRHLNSDQDSRRQ